MNISLTSLKPTKDYEKYLHKKLRPMEKSRYLHKKFDWRKRMNMMLKDDVKEEKHTNKAAPSSSKLVEEKKKKIGSDGLNPKLVDKKATKPQKKSPAVKCPTPNAAKSRNEKKLDKEKKLKLEDKNLKIQSGHEVDRHKKSESHSHKSHSRKGKSSTKSN